MLVILTRDPRRAIQPFSFLGILAGPAILGNGFTCNEFNNSSIEFHLDSNVVGRRLLFILAVLLRFKR